MNQDLNIGDVVVLTAGGPEMTVTKLMEAEQVCCNWFDKEHQLKSAVFPVGAVRKTGPRGPSFAVA